jgi:putative chitinase
MIPSIAQLKAISKATKFTPSIVSNMTSVIVALEKYGAKDDVGLNLPHRLSHYISQLSHENGGFKYDKEIWGNTPAQQRYDTRTDLGNTPAKDGDGKLYMGRTGMQLTGKANYTAFRDWVWRVIDSGAPDFVKKPELVNTDPWEGLVPIWYWTSRNLNRYADQNDLETITKRINGGKNGLADRIDYYSRTALVFLGFGAEDVKGFQAKHGLEVDGDAGPKTRAELHNQLALLAKSAIRADQEIQVTAAPVTQVKEVAVAPKQAEKPAKDNTAIVVAAGTAVASSPVAKPALDTFGGLSQTVQIILICVCVAALIYVFIGRNLIAKLTKETRMDIQEKAKDGLPS